MKKFSLILNIVLVVAVAALFVLFFTNKSKSPKTSNAGTTEQSACAGDIVYIQIDTLVNQYDMFNDLRSELEGKLSAIESDLNKKGRAFENDAKSFENQYNKGLLTRSKAEEMQAGLMQRQQDLQKLSQQKQLEMAEEERVMLNRVMDAIKTYVAEYNKNHEYSLILTTSATTNVVIEGNKSLDITADVLKGLNEEYIKNRNK